MFHAYNEFVENPPVITKEVVDSVERIASNPEEVMKILRKCKYGVLPLSGLVVTDNDIEGYVVPFLKCNPRITHLEIKNNSVYSGLRKLLEVASLLRIDMSENPINKKSLECLLGEKSLKILILEGVPLDDSCCETLSKVTCLQYLGVERTGITKDGFELLKRSSIDAVSSDYGARVLESEEGCDVQQQKISP